MSRYIHSLFMLLVLLTKFSGFFFPFLSFLSLSLFYFLLTKLIKWNMLACTIQYPEYMYHGQTASQNNSSKYQKVRFRFRFSEAEEVGISHCTYSSKYVLLSHLLSFNSLLLYFLFKEEEEKKIPSWSNPTSSSFHFPFHFLQTKKLKGGKCGYRE